ncbi:MAG: reverse transcriptase family protein [Candidatus Binatia bacterium]
MRERLDIVSLRDLEFRLGIPRHLLRQAASKAGSYYCPFLKATRAKERRIDNPTGLLKEIQKAIQRHLLGPLAQPEYLHGGIKHRSPTTNALQHVANHIVVRLDIGNFFPSVTPKHVYAVWHKLLGCSPRIAGLLTKLTTFERHLPQGSPASTSLANLALDRADRAIHTLAAAKGLKFTRFVDDIVFSGPCSLFVVNDTVLVLRAAGFRVPHRKLMVMGRDREQVVTGLKVNSKLNVPHSRVSRIRAAIHQLKMHAEGVSDGAKAQRSIHARIAQVERINPGIARSLRRLVSG